MIFELSPRGTMDTATLASHARRQPELLGQIVVVIGGSAGIGSRAAPCSRSGFHAVRITS